jgi:hypothetical protein
MRNCKAQTSLKQNGNGLEAACEYVHLAAGASAKATEPATNRFLAKASENVCKDVENAMKAPEYACMYSQFEENSKKGREFSRGTKNGPICAYLCKKDILVILLEREK